MGANDVKRMRPPEVENNRLKKIVAEREGWQNGTTERFNGKFRDECLSMQSHRSENSDRSIAQAIQSDPAAFEPGKAAPGSLQEAAHFNHETGDRFPETRGPTISGRSFAAWLLQEIQCC